MLWFHVLKHKHDNLCSRLLMFSNFTHWKTYPRDDGNSERQTAQELLFFKVFLHCINGRHLFIYTTPSQFPLCLHCGVLVASRNEVDMDAVVAFSCRFQVPAAAASQSSALPLLSAQSPTTLKSPCEQSKIMICFLPRTPSWSTHLVLPRRWRLLIRCSK